ncbi:MAG: hypothetical protein A2252_03225 [Elusimicrobia bacterium RIFOXYA2_FULL_39_19]|nr:MAG: hypothetical protein A2252_03225 [Elusimicrobia bacterium RIFOXYA2_FULL_39_19]
MENNKKNILVIYPTPDPRKEVKNVNALLPASTLYASTPASYHYNVTLLDTRLQKDWKTIISELSKQGIYAVGISCMTGHQIMSASEIARYIRSIDANIPLIWGGVHPSLMPVQTLKNDLVDFVVVGLGEETFLDLLNNLKDQSKYPSIEGIGYKSKGEILVNKERGFFDLNKYPMPNYQLLKLEDYIVEDTIPIFTSRGCPHSCSFCYNLVFNHKKYTAQNAEHVIAHIEYLVNKHNIKTIGFVDDNFFVNKKRITEICEAIIKKGLNINLNSGCRADYLDHFSIEFLKLIRKAGFNAIYVGVESGSEKILKEIKKDITVEQVLRINKKLKTAGITPYFGFMGGFPGETIADVKKTLKLMVKLVEDNSDAHVTQIMLATLSPRTDLFEAAKKHGFNPPSLLEQYHVFNYEAWDDSPYPWLKDDYKKFVKEIAYIVTWLDSKNMLGTGMLNTFFSRSLGFIIKTSIKLNLYFVIIHLSRFLKGFTKIKFLKNIVKAILKTKH